MKNSANWRGKFQKTPMKSRSSSRESRKKENVAATSGSRINFGGRKKSMKELESASTNLSRLSEECKLELDDDFDRILKYQLFECYEVGHLLPF